MTLHETADTLKKVSIKGAIVLSVVISLFMTFKIGVFIKDILFPQKAAPGNHTYGKLPALVFPDNTTKEQLTYTINTQSGGFDIFPDRLNVYQLAPLQPNFLNLDKAKTKAKSLQFITDAGEPIPARNISDATYQWAETKDLQRILTMNINTFDLQLTSNFKSSLSVLKGAGTLDQTKAITTATDFINNAQLVDDDIDLTKTNVPNTTVNYYSNPKLYSIDQQTNQLIDASSLSNAEVIRVNFYQKDVAYDLNTGLKNNLGLIATKKMTLPILYPEPPFSTMEMWVAMAPGGLGVVQATYVHRGYIVPAKGTDPTYEIKTPQEAFAELKKGGGYIAAFKPGSDTQILINNAYLAYYIGENTQSYLMPIYVFEGNNGFFGYVSAVRSDLVE